MGCSYEARTRGLPLSALLVFINFSATLCLAQVPIRDRLVTPRLLTLERQLVSGDRYALRRFWREIPVYQSREAIPGLLIGPSPSRFEICQYRQSCIVAPACDHILLRPADFRKARR